jgi:HlyD family secretion protein
MVKERNISPKKDDDFFSSVQIVSSGIKYFLICIVFLTVVLLLWGFLGKIPVKINAVGIISSGFSETTIRSNYPGIVVDIYKNRGDTIHAGDKLIKMIEFDLVQEIDETKLKLSQQQEQISIQLLSLDDEKKQRLKVFNSDKQNLQRQIENIKSKVAFLQTVCEDKKTLLEKGIVTKTDYSESKFNLEAQQELLRDTENKQSMLKFDEESYLNNINIQEIQLKGQKDMLEEQFRNMLKKNEEYSYISSIYDAVIMEILVKNDQTVTNGAKVYTIKILDRDENDLFVDMFVPYNDNAKVFKNMEVVVAPLNVNKNRYGEIIGKVVEINEFPATREFMSNLLVDDDIVSIFEQHGPSYYCKVELEKDPQTSSGLKWTSRRGTPYKINTGMIGNAEIHVDYVSPLSLVIPWLKKEMNDE